MRRELPLVSVVIPALNEELDIAGCIASIGAQTFPLDHVEVLLVDGGSVDDTVGRARNAAKASDLSLRVLTNTQVIQSAALNVGLANAAGEIIVRIDARSIPAPDHIARCVEVLLERTDVGAVGGAQIAHERSARLVDRAIARALNNRYAMGFARYRRRAASGATDTVWMGAFRGIDLQAIGGWDETFAKNEDFELNERLRKNGFVVWFDAEMCSSYLPRTSVGAIVRQYFAYGSSKGAMWATNWRPNARQTLLLAAPFVAVGGAVMSTYLVGWLPVLCVTATGAAFVDAIGNRGTPASPITRLGATVVNGVIGGSWWLGVVWGWLSRPRRRSRAALSPATNAVTVPHSTQADAELTQSRR